MTLESKVSGLFLGRAKNRWPGMPPSAIAKFPAVGPHQLIETGFVADEQADLRVHGGADKAVHHYPAEHYSKWQSKRFDTSFAFKPGGFGENISSLGMTEKNVHVGDIFEIGSAIVQVSQGRQPCWKLNKHTRVDELALHVQKTGRTGWYYRVLQQGEVQIGDTIKLKERLHEAWPLERLIACRFDKNIEREVAIELSQIEELATNWRQYFYKRAHGAPQEDQSARLVG